MGDFAEHGAALAAIAEQLEHFLEDQLAGDPRWIEVGAVTDGLLLGTLSETPPDVTVHGQLWLLGGHSSWALPVRGTFTVATDADVVAAEVMVGDAAVGLDPSAKEPRERPAEWMYRFTWP